MTPTADNTTPSISSFPAPKTPEQVEHGVYLSTACWHDLHTECRLTCKYCELPCFCHCHPDTSTTGGDKPSTTNGDNS